MHKIKIGDKVKIINTERTTLNRIGVVKDIVKLLPKYEKSGLTKYWVKFSDKKSPISEGDFVRNELKKVG